MRIFNEQQNNLVVGFKGLKGSGKTLAMTLFIYMEYLRGKKVYTNYEVSFPHELIDVQKLVELDIELQNSVIAIDELHMICDSRRSSKKQNILMSYFILQSRHRSVNFYYTTQFDRQVDVRIRENTDINVVCENLYIDSDGDDNVDLFRLIIQDKRMRPIRIKNKVLYGKPVFGMYSGDKIIDIFTMKELKRMKGKK
jgi:hypothetical protein